MVTLWRLRPVLRLLCFDALSLREQLFCYPPISLFRRALFVVFIIRIRFGDILTIPARGWGLHDSLRSLSLFS